MQAELPFEGCPGAPTPYQEVVSMTILHRLRGYTQTADWMTGYFNLGLDVKLTLGLITG